MFTEYKFVFKLCLLSEFCIKTLQPVRNLKKVPNFLLHPFLLNVDFQKPLVTQNSGQWLFKFNSVFKR